MKKKKAPLKIVDSNLLIEHFLGAQVMSIRPILLTTGFGGRMLEVKDKPRYYTDKAGVTKLVPDDMWYDDEKGILRKIPGDTGSGNILKHYFDLKKSKVRSERLSSGVADMRTGEETSGFTLFFDTFMIFSAESLQEIKQNYMEGENTPPDWWVELDRDIRKEMQTNERAINVEIKKMQAAGVLEQGFHIGTGYEAGIIISPKVKKFITNKVLTNVENNKINKSMVFKYIIEVSVSSTRKRNFSSPDEFEKISQQYAELIEKPLLADKTYYAFAISQPPNSNLIGIQGQGIDEPDDEHGI